MFVAQRGIIAIVRYSIKPVNSCNLKNSCMFEAKSILKIPLNTNAHYIASLHQDS